MSYEDRHESRSNSDLLLIVMIANNRDLPAPLRMEAIEQVVQEWDAATSNYAGRDRIEREVAKHAEQGTLYGGLI